MSEQEFTQEEQAALLSQTESAAKQMQETQKIKIHTIGIDELTAEKQKEVSETIQNVLDGFKNNQQELSSSPPKQTEEESDIILGDVNATEEDKEWRQKHIDEALSAAKSVSKESQVRSLLLELDEEDWPDFVRVCPNCGFDHKIPLEIKPTPEDKRQFLLSVIAQQPFRKTFDVFGGVVQVTFREPKQYEIDLCAKELRAVTIANNEAGFKTYDIMPIETLSRALTAVSTYELSFKDEYGVKQIIWKQDKELKDIVPKGDDTIVATYVNKLIDAIPNQSMFTVISQLHGDFTSLLNQLTQHFNKPDFWETT